MIFGFGTMIRSVLDSRSFGRIDLTVIVGWAKLYGKLYSEEELRVSVVRE
jgi:hypothetical protein